MPEVVIKIENLFVPDLCFEEFTILPQDFSVGIRKRCYSAQSVEQEVNLVGQNSTTITAVTSLFLQV